MGGLAKGGVGEMGVTVGVGRGGGACGTGGRLAVRLPGPRRVLPDQDLKWPSSSTAPSPGPSARGCPCQLLATDVGTEVSVYLPTHTPG